MEKWTYQFTSVFSTNIIKMKIEDFCFLFNINLQDKENRGLSDDILEDVPVNVRSQEAAATRDATLF